MKKYSILFLLLALTVSACVENPNVTEEAYLSTTNTADSWTNGLARQLALTLSDVVVDADIVSDSYYNNYTQYSKIFDGPEIYYYDEDVTDLQTSIHALREMAEFGIEDVATADDETTDEQLAYMYFCKAYAFILGGELFVGLPIATLGEVYDSEALLETSLDYLDQALALESDADLINAYTLLKARVYYDLGDVDNAKTYASGLISDTDLLFQAAYDGSDDADVGNDMQNATYDNANWFAPLPRLDFLDPKYYYTTSSAEQQPVAVAKAEEAYLIMAEVYVAESNYDDARQTMIDLINNVVNNRDIVAVDDSGELRQGSNRDDYPVEAVDVKFDEDDTYRSGYVLDRQAGDIDVYAVSGTKVTTTEIEDASTEDELLYLIYRLRQEIFMSEGRRCFDLGIKFPICQTEQQANAYVTDEYTSAQIPSFIPLDEAMDDFTVDETTGNVTMVYDMNDVLIENKTSEYVLPFF